MTAKQQLVGAGGIGIVIADFWLGSGRQNTKGLFTRGSGSKGVAQAHAEVKTLLMELAFVLVATIVAGVSDQAGTAMVALIVALGVLWALHHYGGNQNG